MICSNITAQLYLAVKLSSCPVCCCQNCPVHCIGQLPWGEEGKLGSVFLSTSHHEPHISTPYKISVALNIIMIKEYYY